MELLLNIEELSHITYNGWDETFDAKEEKQIKDVLQIDGVEKLARVNIGPGADLLTILVFINTIAETYLVASKILEGSESWKQLITKIKGFISKNQLVSVDEDGAKVLAINFILEHFSYDKLVIVDSHVINLSELSGMLSTSFMLAKTPHNYYILTFSVDGEDHLIIGVRSDGEVKLIKHFGLCNYGLDEIV